MPNGGGGYYPGVDPDGKIPGGLAIAGGVDAATLSVLGQLLTPSVVRWGHWQQNAGIVLTAIAGFTSIPFDTEVQASGDLAYALNADHLTFINAGVYVTLATAGTNDDVSTGYIFARPRASNATGLHASGALEMDRAGTNVAVGIEINSYAVGDTIGVGVTNYTNIDQTIFTELAVLRLA